MAGEWQRLRAADIAAHTAAGPFGSAIGAAHFCDSGVPIIRGSNLSNNVGTRLSDDGLVFLREEKAAEFARSEARQGDLVFTCWGTIDQVGLIDKRSRHKRYIVSNKQMLLSPDPAKADSLFLYYFFSSPQSRGEILNQGIGSSVPGFNLGQLRAFEVFLPPLPEQKRIAHILGTLDDKIELNRRMNATLEAMSRAIFKSWFVDFDPVRQKAAGKQPVGMDAQTAALFPDSFEDSEIGEVPKGWQTLPLKDVCDEIFSGGTPSTREPLYWGGHLGWLSSGETRQSFIVATEKTITQAGVDNSSTRLARAFSTVIASAGQGHTRGQTSFLTMDTYINQSVVSLKANQSLTSDVFLYFDLERRYEQFRRISDSHSSRGSLTTALLGSIPVVVPSRTTIEEFDRQAKVSVERMVSHLRESRTLAALRDTLLPKLLSGEIRVPEAVDIVEEATA